MTRRRTLHVLVAMAMAISACGDSVTGETNGATCAELTDVMLGWAQDDLSEIELWPADKQAELLANAEALSARSHLVYVHMIFSRLGDQTCGAEELLAVWCRRIDDLVAGSRIGRFARAWMIESQCGAA